MIIKTVLDSIHIEDKQGKFGPVKYMTIKIPLYPSKNISAFINKPNDPRLQWKTDGSEKTIVLEENGQYLNFRLPEKVDLLEDEVKEIEKKRLLASNALKNLMAWAKDQGFDSTKTY